MKVWNRNGVLTKSRRGTSGLSSNKSGDAPIGDDYKHGAERDILSKYSKESFMHQSLMVRDSADVGTICVFREETQLVVGRRQYSVFTLNLRKGTAMSIATRDRTNNTQKINRNLAPATGNWVERVEAAGRHSIRYGLVLVLLWVGGMKFTAYEAEGVSGFVSNSPLMSWAYRWFSKEQFSVILGITELLTAVLIALRPFSARLSAVGSALAVGMFLTTLSFLVSTPGVIEPSLGFPALSALPGQFLIKDFVLLGAALWTTGEALRAVRPQRSRLDLQGVAFLD
jgi:uncharacterized membrane protein YkgB